MATTCVCPHKWECYLCCRTLLQKKNIIISMLLTVLYQCLQRQAYHKSIHEISGKIILHCLTKNFKKERNARDIFSSNPYLLVMLVSFLHELYATNSRRIYKDISFIFQKRNQQFMAPIAKTESCPHIQLFALKILNPNDTEHLNYVNLPVSKFSSNF